MEHDTPPPPAAHVFNKFWEDATLLASRLRLSLEHKNKIPSRTASVVYEEAISFASNLLMQFCEVVALRVAELGVQDVALQGYLACTELKRAFATPRRDESLLLQLGYIPPREVDLISKQEKTEPPPRKRGRQYMHFVPILDTLKSYLSHEDVLSQVLRETVQCDTLRNFSDGSLFAAHPLFSQDPHALRISLYSDEIQVCNPLGSSNIKHKLCCVYFQVQNVGNANLSSLESIHLAILVRWPYAQKFGYKLIFEDLIADLNKLSAEGIKVKVKGGGTVHFRGAVTNLVGDNATMHMLGQFNGSFSQGKVCRFCLVDYKNLSKKSNEDDCTLRTTQGHARHVALVEANPKMGSIYGAYGESPISSLAYFKIPDSLPPDVMHDVLEKAMALNVKVVLKGLHQAKVLRFSRARALLSSFKFGKLDTVNKAPPLSEELMGEGKDPAKIRGSASQKWHLFRFFSLALGPHVPRDNKFWKLHLLLHKICDILFAVAISKDMVRELALLITAHHKLWLKLVTGSYPPKLHYLIHYPKFIFLMGPPRTYWCMRFEASHQYLKRLSQACNNFVNVTRTLSERIPKKKLYSALW